MALSVSTAEYGPIREAVVILAGAAIVIPLFHRMRVSPVLGFMLVGVLAGPSGLGALVGDIPALVWVTIADRERIAPLAEWGVVLLLFMIGLELSLARITTMRRLVFGLGGLQVAVCAAAVAATAWGLGQPPRAAVVLGLALAMSSTAVVAQVLASEKRMTTHAGRVTFAVLLFQDLAVVPILFVLGLMTPGETHGWDELALALGKAAAAIALIVGLGRVALRPLFRSVATTHSPELFMAACLLVVLITSLVAAKAGLSMALGALLAGLLLAETEYRRQIEVTLEPFKGLLLGVFLISIGLSLDLGAVFAQPALILGLAVALVAGKAAIVMVLGRAFRLRAAVSGPAGLLLGPGGEFSFVILGLGVALQAIQAATAVVPFIVAALTMATVPLLSWLGTRLFRAAPAEIDTGLLPPDHVDSAAHAVIVVGYGRVGQTVAALLRAHGLAWLALESDIRRVARAHRQGLPVYLGTVLDSELLRRVGLETARALVVTVDDRLAADRIVSLARAARPDLLVIVRARDAAHAAELYALGASDAVPETIEASLQLAEAVLVDLGVPMGRVLVSIHEHRAAFQDDIKARVPGASVRTRGAVRLRGAGEVAAGPGGPAGLT